MTNQLLVKKNIYSLGIALGLMAPSFSIYATEEATNQAIELATAEKPMVVHSRFDTILKDSFEASLETVDQKELFLIKMRLLNEFSEGILARIATIIRYVGTALQDHSLKISPIDRTNALQELAKIQPLFEGYLHAQLGELSKQTHMTGIDDTILTIIERSLFLAEQIVDYLTSGIKTNFKKQNSFNLTSSDIKPLSKEHLEKVKSKLAILEKQIQTLGLTYTNKVSRFLTDQVISPITQVHSYFPVGKIAGITALLGGYYLWKNGTFTTILGEYPKYAQRLNPQTMLNEQVLDNKALLKIPGQLVDAYRSLLSDPISGTMVAGLGVTAYGFYENIKGAIQPYIQKLWNKARGGLYGELSIEGLFSFEPRKTLDDVIGHDPIKIKMQEIVACMANPEGFMLASKKRSMRYIFGGASRTGKTHMATALCGSIKQINPKCNILVVEYHHIMQLGIKNIFAMAKMQAPTILFFDEAHLLRLQEDGNKELLKEFLTVMGGQDDFDPSKPVVVIMATTHPEHMDTALKNRFEMIHFELPNASERTRCIEKQLENNLLNTSTFDVRGLTEKSEGMTFADIEALFSQATIKAWIEGKLLTQALLDDVFNETLRKIVPQSYQEVTDKRTSQEIATYIAGKAVLTSLLETNKPLDTCTINKIRTDIKEDFTLGHKAEIVDHNGQYGAIFRRSTQEHRGTTSSVDMEHDIKILLGGRAALKIIFNTETHGLHKTDDQKAYELIKKWLTPAIQFDGSEMKNKMEAEAYTKYTNYFNDVTKMLAPHKNAIALISKVLQVHGTLSGDYIRFILSLIKEKGTISEQEQQAIIEQGEYLLQKFHQQAAELEQQSAAAA